MSGSTKFCRYCREEIPVDSEFCEKCGKVLTPKEAATPLPKNETVTTPPSIANQKPRNAKRLFLGVLIIAIILVSVIVISYVPNPLIKHHPWISIEWVSIYSYYSYGYNQPVSITQLLLGVSIHNPTHRTYQVGVNDALLGGELITASGIPFQLATIYGNPLSEDSVQLWSDGNWTNLSSSTQLQSCSPTLVGLVYTIGTVPDLSDVQKGNFQLNLTLTINGANVMFTSNLTETFTSTPTQTTATTTTTSQQAYKAPDECVLPWV